MDEWAKRHPYHCLPLGAMNSYGWTLLCERTFEATWNGGSGKDGLSIVASKAGSGASGYSHFGGGVLTFSTGFIFRTEDPYQLVVTGPLNMAKDGISALSAIVETAWLPFTFSMNWIFTRPGITVRFEQGEPYCQFYPIIPEIVQETDPECRDLESDPVLWKQYQEWLLSRRLSRGIALDDGGRLQHGKKMQHIYHSGTLPNGRKISERPSVRYMAKPFVDNSTCVDVSYEDLPQQGSESL